MGKAAHERGPETLLDLLEPRPIRATADDLSDARAFGRQRQRCQCGRLSKLLCVTDSPVDALTLALLRFGRSGAGRGKPCLQREEDRVHELHARQSVLTCDLLGTKASRSVGSWGPPCTVATMRP